MKSLVDHITSIIRNPALFWRRYTRIKLRKYQIEVALAIIDSVKYGMGLTFCVVFPRQAGKSETQVRLEAYLLTALGIYDARIVKVQPTWIPQALRAMQRLEQVLNTNLLTKDLWGRENGCCYRVGAARIHFLSADRFMHGMGVAANALLEVDEAQDVSIALWEKEILPMAVSANVTRVLWGTAGSDKTLLAREIAACLELEKVDHIKRVFTVTADDVGKEAGVHKAVVNYEVIKIRRLSPIVKEAINRYGGFPKVTLKTGLPLIEIGEILASRGKIIEEVMAIINLDYASAYTILVKTIRRHYILKLGRQKASQPVWMFCAVCNKPLLTCKRTNRVLCSFHKKQYKKSYDSLRYRLRKSGLWKGRK